MELNWEEIIGKINLLPDDEKQQDMRYQDIKIYLKKLHEKTEMMNSNGKETIRILREAAKKQDDVWRDCKAARAVGTGVQPVGGLLSISGGIATLMTAGAASPLF